MFAFSVTTLLFILFMSSSTDSSDNLRRLGIVLANRLFGHTETINHGRIWWVCGFGKRLTWRRSPHGLVGWEMTVNSGPFSQLPVETNTNDYPAIVSMEATRHLQMLTKSYALQRSLAWGLWGAPIWVKKTTAFAIMKPYSSNSETLQFLEKSYYLIMYWVWDSKFELWKMWNVEKKELINIWVAHTQLLLCIL